MSPAQTPPPQPTLIGGVPYEKLADRTTTERRMRDLLNPQRASWGEWYLLAPFPYEGKTRPDMATALPPEAELARMKPGAPGPDLGATYKGKKGVEVSWRPLGDIASRAIDLAGFDDWDLNVNFAAYLYGTVTVDKPTTVDATMGSDDGLRFWLNGRLLVDQEVLRGLDPESVRVRLDLQPGINHLLAKVTQVEGAASFQINSRAPLDPYADALLQYHLDLDFPLTPEDRYYRALTIPMPKDVVLEVGGLDVLPDGRPIASTRRGDIYIVSDAYGDPPFNATFTKFASGLHEALGLSVRQEDGKTAVYTVQRAELTRLVDDDGDDVADTYETFSDGWGVSGNYHEFAFGPKFDRDGNAWVTLNVGFCGALGKSVVPWRGWALKVAPDGTITPVCDGLRSPNGIGMYSDGSMFYLDNQGDYIATNRLSQLVPGSFQGHPAGLRWREGWSEGAPLPAIQPASVWFPYKKMGQSTADFLLCDQGGKFGPYDGQIFVGDQTLCTVMRVDLEKVGDLYQGACFPFRSGLDCGVNRLAWGQDGSLFVGETDRGWGSIGRLRFGLQRIAWTGEIPFEVLHMRVRPDGFELEFTKDIDPITAADPASYRMISYTYEHHVQYGCDEMDTAEAPILSADSVGPRRVRLRMGALRSGGMGYVYELAMPGVRAGGAAGGDPLLHDTAYYTIQRVPTGPMD